MRRMIVSGLCVVAMVGCARKDAARPAPAQTSTPAPTQPSAPATPSVTSADVPLTAPVTMNLMDINWGPGPDSLPKGIQVAVLEGAPPFPADRTFTMALRLPKNYAIPPHTHLVTERVTVLQGTINFGHGQSLDRNAAKKLGPGGIVIVPRDHAHYVFTTDDEVILSLQGIGPWGIFYVNPKDDPRGKPPEKPMNVAARFEAPVTAQTLDASEIAFKPAPEGMLPPGAQIAILEGDPKQNKSFTMRVKVPDLYRIPVHTHSVTDRLTVLAGSLSLGLGTQVEQQNMKDVRVGGLVILPKDIPHYAMAKGETVFQVMGVGPFDIKWADPQEDPARRPQTSVR